MRTTAHPAPPSGSKVPELTGPRPLTRPFPRREAGSDTRGGDMDETIVVGVDGSPVSRTALGWAVEEAKLRGCAVEAVLAWHVDHA
ncbi:universal stress protein, partial [Actinosynnema sp. NPDC049800]